MTHMFDGNESTPEERAALWVVRQHSGEWSAAEQRRLDTWLAESQAHREAYRRALEDWHDLERFKHVRLPAREAAHRYRLKIKKRRLRRQFGAVASVAMVVLLVGLRFQPVWFAEHYETAFGQRQRVDLEDGSRLDLNTDTALEVWTEGGERHVRLIRGEVYCSVTHDLAHPFRVTAGTAEIRDIGTRFDVRMDAGQVSVGVDEGEVEVHGVQQPVRRLTAGHVATVDGDGRIGSPLKLAAHASAWLQGRMTVERAPLADVLKEMSRYHAVTWDLADEYVRNRRLTGSFDLDDLGGFLDLLQTALHVTVERTDPSHIRLSKSAR